MALTVIFASAIICSGALAASSYRGAIKRGLVMALFVVSALASGGIGLGISASVSTGCGVFYHINAICFIICYVLLGLVMARSRIRLTVHHYEVKPSWMVIGLLIFTPLVVGMATLVSFGWLSGLGFAAMAIVSKYADVSPKAPGYRGLANSNIAGSSPPPAMVLTTATSEPVISAPIKEEGSNPLASLPKPVSQKPIKKYPKVDNDGWK